MSFAIPDPRWEEPNLLIPGRKPTGPVVIDWSHPMTAGLISMPTAVYGGFSDLTNKVSWTTLIPQNYSVWYGQQVYSGDNGEPFRSTDSRLITLLQGDQFTIFVNCVYGPTSTTNPAIMGWSGADDLVFYPNDSVYSNKQRVFWRNSPIGVSPLVGGVDGPVGSVVSMVLTFENLSGTAYQKGYVNGSLITSGSAANAARGSVTHVEFGRWETQGAADAGRISGAAMWDRCLSPAEVGSLSRNPYQFLIPA